MRLNLLSHGFKSFYADQVTWTLEEPGLQQTVWANSWHGKSSYSDMQTLKSFKADHGEQSIRSTYRRTFKMYRT